MNKVITIIFIFIIIYNRYKLKQQNRLNVEIIKEREEGYYLGTGYAAKPNESAFLVQFAQFHQTVHHQ